MGSGPAMRALPLMFDEGMQEEGRDRPGEVGISEFFKTGLTRVFFLQLSQVAHGCGNKLNDIEITSSRNNAVKFSVRQNVERFFQTLITLEP